jgi:Zn finger protein HypA/HybF involved in hydrogenase expression
LTVSVERELFFMADQPDPKQEDLKRPEWLAYEELAMRLLNRLADKLGLQSVEGKQEIKGERSGTKWEIDGKGITQDGKGFFIVECRRYTTSKQNQEKVGSLAYRILDIRADGAILVSPMGFQEGAEKVAKAENILSVRLGEDSTLTNFVIQFLNQIWLGVGITAKSSVRITPRFLRACATCGELFPTKEHETLCSNCRQQGAAPS